jgi:hypothetical protein
MRRTGSAETRDAPDHAIAPARSAGKAAPKGGFREPAANGRHHRFRRHAIRMLPTASLPVRRSSWVSKETF